MGEAWDRLWESVIARTEESVGVTVSTTAIEALLDVITSGVVDAVDGASCAGMTVLENGVVASFASTDPVSAQLDELQARHDVGPSLSAARKQRVVVVDDYATDTRWQRLFRDVVERTPARSGMSFPLYRDPAIKCALNVYADRAHAFDAVARELAATFAGHAALALHNCDRERQFREALASRDEIGQAKGMLMERFAIGADQAFAMLRVMSLDTNVKLVELARRLIATNGSEKN